MIQLRAAELLLQTLGITDPRDIDLEAIAFDQGALVRRSVLDGELLPKVVDLVQA
jgi:hypothetical protein